MPTKVELERRIAELEEENDDLQDALDQIADLAAPPDEDTDEHLAGDDEEGDDEEDDSGKD